MIAAVSVRRAGRIARQVVGAREDRAGKERRSLRRLRAAGANDSGGVVHGGRAFIVERNSFR